MSAALEFRMSDFIEKFFYLNGSPFSLDDYPFMKLIYNIDPPEMVFNTSRQISKCLRSNDFQQLANGQKKLVVDLQPGEELLSFDEESQKVILNKIKAVEDNGKKIIYKIKTRTGRTAEVTGEHPFWTLNPKWTEAKYLQEGDLIGLSRNNAAALPTEKTVPDYEYIILAHLLAEGGLTSGGIRYSNSEEHNIKELETAVKEFDSKLELKPLGDKYPGQYTITAHTYKNSLVVWLRKLGLFGCNSQTKFHPELVYRLTKEQLQDYLKIWTNTDGYVSVSGRISLPEIGITLISKELIEGLQELFLRLGIHTARFIKTQPKVYEGTNKQCYALRVEGADSIERFYELIPTHKLKSYRKTFQNNNRSVVPKKALQAYFTKLKKQQYGNLKNTRYNHGWTQWQLSYDMTYSKLKELKENLNDSYLKEIYDADIIYDRITSIEVLPAEPTTAIEMEAPYNTFLIDNLVTHNSTTLANLGLGRMVIMPQTRKEFSGGFKTLYIAPTVEQVKLFSHDRVTPVVEQTPFIKKHFVSSGMIQNVFLKRFTNGSSMYFRYAAASADKARGISCDMIIADEVQDIPDDNITIIQQSMSRSLYKRTIYAGTPKRTIGTLAKRWDVSTRNEWYVKCTGCNRYNYLDEANIQPWGLGCRYCKSPLDPRNGTWVRTNPGSIKGDTNSATPGKYLFEGFRISVLQFAKSPWVDWQKDVWLPYQTKPRGIFLNEYLGIAYDAGVAPITEADIRACCTGGPMRTEPDAHIMSYPRFIGMDWGPINSANSRTVQTVLVRRGEMVEVVYMKKYIGRESDYSFLHGEIPAQFNKWKCDLMGADAGFGEAVNSEIRKRIYDPKRLIALQHLGNQKQKANWNHNMMAYTLGRNTTMTALFTKIKNRQIIFPRWEDFAPFADDLLSIQIDYDEEKNKYKYINSRPDDAFHSILYADFVSELWYRTQGQQ